MTNHGARFALYSRLLASRGVGASSGAEAICLLEKHASEIDCVLTELYMPGVSGMEWHRKRAGSEVVTRSKLALYAPVRRHPLRCIEGDAAWFPVVKTFADTAYHREVLAECGTYRTWYRKHPG